MTFAHQVGSLLLCCCFLLSINVSAQEEQDSSNQYFAAIPIVYRTPETSWAFGVGAAYNFRLPNDTLGNRPSQLQLGAVYTLQEQWLFYLPYQLYFYNNRYNFNGEIGYYYYFYQYYGIGNATQAKEEEIYLASFPRVKWEGLIALSPVHFIGLTYDFDRYNILEIEEDGLLKSKKPTAYQGGVISEPGLIAYHDSRNQIFYPTEGNYTQLDLYFGSSLTGSVSDYAGLKLDARKYFNLPWNHTIAIQYVHEIQFGDVPFFRLAQLGGPKLLRGYIRGRFRDKRMALIQASYRMPIFWRFKLTAFGGYGAVNEKIALPLFENGHWSYGIGLRFLADRDNHLHIRVDYARGQDQSGFYLTIGEAF